MFYTFFELIDLQIIQVKRVKLRKQLFILLVALLVFNVGFGQNRDVVRDSTKRDSVVTYRGKAQDTIARDSTHFYNQVRKFSKKTDIGKFLQKLILVDSAEYYKKGKDLKEEEKETGADQKMSFKGDLDKIIRHIKIETYDPFGYDLEDTTQKPHSWFQKVGNAAHIKSLPAAISKFLLIRENEKLDTFLLRESARILRAQNYIHEIHFEPEPVPGTDSLDIVVRVLDSWSLIPKLEISGSHYNVGAQERNFIGLGHELRVKFSHYYSDGNNGYEARYNIPNIQNTFIGFTGKYAKDHESYHDRYINIGRRFYSTTTRWAGGIFVQDRSLFRPLPGDTATFVDKDFRFIYQDYWLGRAFPVADVAYGKKDQQNIILSGRAFLLNYKDRPGYHFDSIRHFSNEQFYLASVGLNSRRYIQDQYIFQDGRIEDVPVGSSYSMTAGFQRKNHQSRFYTGVRAAYGRYFNWGFLSTDMQVGSFIHRGRLEQGVISFKINYFSKLKTVFGDWKMRQFIKPQIVIGFNRKPGFADRLSLNDEFYYNGINSSEYLDYDMQDRYVDYKTGSIRGFESEATGTQKYVLDLQTQFYSPWNLWGFHINPFGDITLGYLAGKKYGFGSNKLYSAFSVGVIIRNDFLVFDAFQLSLSYYPIAPGKDGRSWGTNAFRNHEFGFQNFESTQPRPVIYE